MKKIFDYIIHPKKIIIYLMNKNFFFFINDNMYLKKRFRLIMGCKLDLNCPKTFNEKLQWLKLYDRNPVYTNLVDKYEVKKIVSNLIGNEYIIPTLGVYNTFEEIDFSKLPNQFVIKCTHDSGGIVICKDKNELDLKKVRKKICKSLKRNYFYSGREWPYKNIKPRIIIEKYMIDDKYKDLIDYKIMCFNGIPKYTFVYSDRFSNSGVKASFFDINWSELSFKRGFQKSNIEIKKPKNYNKMLEFSKKLAKNIPFVRIDWYEVNGNLYFGEITFFPNSGFGKFEPNHWDLKLGKMLRLPIVEVSNEK